MSLEMLRNRVTGSENSLWWTFRFLDHVVRDHGASEPDKSEAVDCFLRLAAEDPVWATRALTERGPEGHRLATLLSQERLTSALGRIELPTVKADAMLRARMLVASASWQGAKAGDLLRRAWAELCRVSIEERDDDWNDAALAPASVVDYAQYQILADARLLATTEDFYRAAFLPEAIAVAARHHEWSAFDRWVSTYRALPVSLLGDHADCAVVNLEGERALNDGRREAAILAMEKILALAATLTFLSNENVSLLAKRLRKEGIRIDLCDRFDEIVKARDWRLLKK
jgi:hypothetical protein